MTPCTAFSQTPTFDGHADALSLFVNQTKVEQLSDSFSPTDVSQDVRYACFVCELRFFWSVRLRRESAPASGVEHDRH